VKVFLIRHADAVEEGPRLGDDQRYLTSVGRQVSRAVGTALRAAAIELDLILTSPLVRAVQTAELVAGAMDHLGVIEAASWLGTGVHPRVAAEDLAGRTGSIALVGHEPHLSALAGLLVQRPSFPPFRKGQVTLIEDGQPAWWLNPETLAIERLLVP
jgi:phosphohistidine phosphatase